MKALPQKVYRQRPDFQGEALDCAVVIRPHRTSDEASRLSRVGIDDKVPPFGLEADTVAGSDFCGNGDIAFPASAYSPKADFIEPRWEPLILAKRGNLNAYEIGTLCELLAGQIPPRVP